nr:TonB-dependent receptor [Phenylobacterium glaciei]
MSGDFTLKAALTRLTAGAGCRFEIIDIHTVRILPEAPEAAGAAPTPSKPGPQPLPDPVAEILVTATKRPVAYDRLPASLSLISASQLQITGATDAAGAVRQVAGVTMTNLGPGRDKILLRGLSDGAFTGRTRSTVGTFLDYVPITYNAPDPDLRLADVQAIEVLRGPQGALYGGGSLSGVYRIITRKPEFNLLQGALTAGAAWTETGSPGYEAEGMVNLPLVHDRAALRLVAYTEVEGGYLDDVNLRLSDVDQTKRIGGRLALAVQINDTWSVTVGGAVQQLDSNDTQYVTPGPNRLRRANRIRERHKNDFGEAAVTVIGSGDWGRLESSTAYVRHAYSSLYDASAALNLYGSSTADLGVFEEYTKVDMVVEDAVLTSPGDSRLQWLAGLYGAWTLEKSPSVLRVRATAGPPVPVYVDDRSDRLITSAVYGQASYRLARGWTLAAGARVFETDLRTSSAVQAPLTGATRAFTRKAQFKGWSPQLTLQHDFQSGAMLYLLASEGGRPGGFNSGGISAPAPSRKTFQPDRLRNFEVGTKLRLFDRRLSVQSAVFYDLWNNIQTDQYLPSGLPYTANVGDGRNIGLEIEATWRPTTTLTVQANALLNSSKVTKVNPIFATRVQDRLPGVPDASVGALATYERPLRDNLSLILTAESGYVGRSRLTFDPALSPEMGGYIASKLSVQLKGPDWRVAAFVSNPNNTQGDTFAYGNPFSFGQVRQVTPQRPRTLSLLLSRTF